MTLIAPVAWSTPSVCTGWSAMPIRKTRARSIFGSWSPSVRTPGCSVAGRPGGDARSGFRRGANDRGVILPRRRIICRCIVLLRASVATNPDKQARNNLGRDWVPWPPRRGADAVQTDREKHAGCCCCAFQSASVFELAGQNPRAEKISDAISLRSDFVDATFILPPASSMDRRPKRRSCGTRGHTASG